MTRAAAGSQWLAARGHRGTSSPVAHHKSCFAVGCVAASGAAFPVRCPCRHRPPLLRSLRMPLPLPLLPPVLLALPPPLLRSMRMPLPLPLLPPVPLPLPPLLPPLLPRHGADGRHAQVCASGARAFAFHRQHRGGCYARGRVPAAPAHACSAGSTGAAAARRSVRLFAFHSQIGVVVVKLNDAKHAYYFPWGSRCSARPWPKWLPP